MYSFQTLQLTEPDDIQASPSSLWGKGDPASLVWERGRDAGGRAGGAAGGSRDHSEEDRDGWA